MRRLKGHPMAARLQRGTTPTTCVTPTEVPGQNAATIIKPFVLNPYSTPFTHGATFANWVAPFPVVSIPLLLFLP